MLRREAEVGDRAGERRDVLLPDRLAQLDRDKDQVTSARALEHQGIRAGPHVRCGDLVEDLPLLRDVRGERRNGPVLAVEGDVDFAAAVLFVLPGQEVAE